MPNSIGATGLTTKTQAEYIEEMTIAYRGIYGNDINLESDTPDGQMMMIYIQMLLDLGDLLTQINNQFDPDLAIGRILDQRVAINGIQRQAGTHTTTNITVVVSQSVNLYGIDQAVQDPYRVSDQEGTQWELLESVTLGAGTHVIVFRAVTPGEVLSVPNSITIPITVVLGVVSVNNPTTYTTLGLTEESDAELKIRRQRSTALSSQGYLAGLLAALENISGVVAAYVYENVTGSTDGDGIPSHSIWVIVSGAPSPASVANAIYTKRNAGCGMKGDETFSVAQADGSLFTIRWDWVVPEDLFIEFTATSLDGVNPPNLAAIREQLPALMVPGVYEQVNVNDLATLIQQIDNNTLVTDAGFSTSLGGSYTPTLLPTTKASQFVVSAENIIALPIIVSPSAPDPVDPAEEIQFSAVGGYGEYTWSLEVDNSGGSIDSSTGLYTAGATPTVTDTIRVTDDDGNFTDVEVDVN